MKNQLSAILQMKPACWKRLVFTDLVYKGLAFILLSPLLSILFRALISLSGDAVLSDLDIAFFLAGPAGWFCAIVAGAVWLGVVAMEQASLLAILAADSVGKSITTLEAILFAIKRGLAVTRVAGRMIIIAMLVFCPFLLAAFWIYQTLLTDYDINFYLRERPARFQIAVGVESVLLIIAIGILLRFLANWFVALPLILFHRVQPQNALTESRQLVKGQRLQIVGWLSLWALAGIAVHSLVTFLTGSMGSWVLPSSVGSLATLAGRVGALLLLLTGLGIVVNTLWTVGFAMLLFHIYRRCNYEYENSVRTAILQTSWSTNDRLWNWKLTPTRLVALSTIGVMTSGLAGVTTLNTLQLKDDVHVMAHRGASQMAPENSMASIRAAIEARADWVEIDVQETADDQIVVVHDSDLMKVAANPLKVWDATMQDLRFIDIGSRFDSRFANERVPTLFDVLTLCRDQIGVVIELKYYGHDRQLEERVAQIVDRCQMADQIMIMSLKLEGVRKMKALRPNLTCGLLMSVSIGDIQRVHADFVAVNSRAATRKFVEQVHRAGKEVYVWTVNDAATMHTLLNRGIDGLLTDRPELARQVIEERNALNSSERLLAEIALMFGAKPKPGTN